MSRKARIVFLENLPAALKKFEIGVADECANDEALMESSGPESLGAEQISAIKSMTEIVNAAERHFAALNRKSRGRD